MSGATLHTAIDWAWYETNPIPSIPSDTKVVTKNGEAISIFSDDLWDYEHVGGKRVLFNNWLGYNEAHQENDELYDTIKEQLKSIIYALQCERFLNHSSTLSKITVTWQALKPIARIAYSLGIPLDKAKENEQFINALKISLFQLASDTDINKSGEISKTLAATSLLQTLREINIVASRHNDFAFMLVTPEILSELDPLISVISEGYDRGTGRTLLIPPRIYTVYIDFFKQICEDVNNSRDMFAAILHHPDFHDYKKRRDIFDELGFNGLVDKYNMDIKRGFYKNIETLRNKLYYGLSLYSGMRKHEVRLLPYNALETITVDGFGEIHILNSYTRKLEKTKRPANGAWTTDKNGAEIFKTIQYLTRLLWEKKYKDTHEWIEDDIPIAVTYRPSKKPSPHYPEYCIADLGNIKKALKVKVEPEDIQSLRTFDSARDWGEIVEVGKDWPIALHQFRRSLAVYASRSGIVSLPQMKTQLKHMSEVMTALYAENSIFAQKIILGDNGELDRNKMGIVLEFRANEALHKARTFNKALDSNNRLSGPAGTKLQRMKDTNTIPHVFKSEKELIKLVESGQLSAKETLLGVCVKDGMCSSYGIDEITPCGPQCPNHIGGIDGTEKLEIYIEELEYSLEQYSPESKYGKALAYEINQRKIELEEALENEA